MNVIEDEDDAWSYSFPPSVDSLPLDNTKKSDKEDTKKDHNENNSNNNMDDDSNGRPLLHMSHKNGNSAFVHEEKKLATSNGDNGIDSESQISSSSSTERAGHELTNRKLKIVTPSSKASRSSLSLQSPFIQKATPADPKTTKHDANSIISKDSSGNGLFQDTIKPEDTDSPVKSSFLSNLGNSVIGFQVQEVEGTDHKDSLASPKSSNGFDSPKSPKIIEYRKSRRTISEGDFGPILDVPDNVPTEKYDPRMYADEFFSSTNYRYAAMKRNIDFHQLFRSIDLTDRLLDDFACALSREILLQGRIYISETYVCFNSNLLGWVTNIIIPMQDIIGFEKKHTAGLFPNGIAIETKDTKHTFASFLSRDLTYEFITTVWEESTGLKLDDPDLTNNSSIINGIGGTPRLSVEENIKNEEECSPRIKNYIMSIDETEAENYSDVDASDEDDDEEDYEEYVGREVIKGTTSNRSSLEQQSMTNKVLHFTADSNYKNIGPDSHSPTEVGDSFTPEAIEIELCNEIIDAPLGIVFAIAFSETNTSFHRRFIETHDGSELSEYNVFHPMEDDPTKSERKYTYRRALGYSIGPKSTKCEVSEVIEYLNFANYINVVSTTATPDVPSGNSFTVKTRYIFTWAENNKTNLKMSFFIKWTGTSWIKGVIEKQSLAGQKAVVSDYIEGLRKEIADNTSYVEGLAISEPLVEETIKPLPVIPVKVKKAKEVKKPSTIAFFKDNLVYIGYLNLSFFVILLIVLLRLFSVVSESNELIKSQVLINTHLIYAIQAISTNQIDEETMTNHEKNELWKWVDQTYGKRLSPVEKVKFLTYQLQNIYQDDFEKSKKSKKKKTTFNDIKQSVKEFKYQDYLKVDNIPNAVKEQLV